MFMIVAVWGLSYIVTKQALEALDPLSLLFFKYVFAFALICIIKLKMDRGSFIRKKDIPLYAVCSLIGDVLYFYCEYTAMSFLPVALLSIIITFAPAVSVVIERVLFNRRASAKVIIGVAICIFGVVLIIGVDFSLLADGRLTGYLLAFVCILSWNVYNFITIKLHDEYSTVSLTFNQIVCTLLFLAPYVIHRSSELPVFTPALVAQLLYIGTLSGGVGFLIQVRALYVIGPTVTMLFVNFMPVATTFFGWLILKETITPVQIIGGIIVLAAGYIVIKEKDKMEELTDE